MQMLTEVWLPVKGFDCHEVSNAGRVRRNGVELPLHRTRGDYLRVSLSEPGKKGQVRYIHCVVAEAFIGPRLDGMEVNHKDANKANNTVANLEYVTHTENMRHAYRLSLVPIGEDAPNSKYTESQVRRAYELAASGLSYRKAAEETGVHYSFVCDLCSGRAWKHLKLPVLYRNRCSWRLEKV